MTDPTSYQLGYGDAKAGKPSAFPVAPPVVVPPPVIAVGPQSLDEWITKANAGDLAMRAKLANGPDGTYQVHATLSPSWPNALIKFPATARLICPTPIPNTDKPGNVWVPKAPGVVIDGFHVDELAAIYFTPFDTTNVLRNLTIFGAYNVVYASDTPVGKDASGKPIDFALIENVRTTNIGMSVVFYGTLHLRNCFSEGSWGEMCVRVSTNAKTPAKFLIEGGEYSNWKNKDRKATFADRGGDGDVVPWVAPDGTVHSTIFHGSVGVGQIFQPPNPLLPPGPLQPGYFAQARFKGVTFGDTFAPGTKPNNNDNPSVRTERGAITVIDGCNFPSAGLTPFRGFKLDPHRFPISTPDDGSSMTTATNCTVRAPSVGAPGGVPGTILPQAGQPGYAKLATESGTRWFLG